jgi:AcrR family transcriptional regulator
MGTASKTAHSRRPLVVEAATTVFLRYGYARTTMQDIAEAVGVTRPTLYLSFPDKERIFRAVIETLVADNLARIRHGLPAWTTLNDQLRYACETWCVPGYEIVRNNPDAKDLFDLRFTPVRESYAVFEELLVEVLQTGLSGTGSDVAATELAHMIGCALKGFKDIASETPELRRLIGTLSDAVCAIVAQRTAVGAETTGDTPQ